MDDLAAMIENARNAAGAIGADLAVFGGLLRCPKCGREQPLGDVGHHMGHGWPECCGLTMTWVTRRQLSAEGREVPEGYHLRAVEDTFGFHDLMRIDATRRCRHLLDRRSCGERSVIALLRGITRKTWWGYCVTPETPILTAELRWVPAGDLTVGQELVTVDEQPTGNPEYQTALMRSNRNRFYRRGQVLAVPRRIADCVRLTLADGRQVTSAADHNWLAWHEPVGGAAYYRRRALLGYEPQGYRWTPAHAITAGMAIASPLRLWPEESSFEAGWVSGLFDGEGWISRHGSTGTQVGFAQNAGPVLDGVLKYLDNRDIPYNVAARARDDCMRVTISCRWATMELMGRLRPVRLLSRANQLWEDWRIIKRGPNHVSVVAVEPAGAAEVVSLETSTRTYLAAGLVAHNCEAHAYGRWIEDGRIMCWILEADADE